MSRFVLIVTAAWLVACTGGLDHSLIPGERSGTVAGGDARQDLFEIPVPRASCGPGSNPEPGLQGMGPDAGEAPYICNLELVGQMNQIPNPLQMAAHGDCAYFDNWWTAPPGTVVVDVAEPSDPRMVSSLMTPAMVYPHESLALNSRRGLLAAVQGWGGLVRFGSGLPVSDEEPFFDVYDVTGDCTQPQLLASIPISRNGHEGNWAPDGMTYYGVGFYFISVIDAADPSAPDMIAALEFDDSNVHGLSVSEDGNRLYQTWYNQSTASERRDSGLVIFDTSDAQARTRDPQFPIVSVLSWPETFAAQHTLNVVSGGRPFVIHVDEGNGGAVFIEITDEANPVIVSTVRLEVNVLNLSAATPLAFGSHYCSVDRTVDPTILGCGFFQSGLRFFDIRDPYAPKEIAYYEPNSESFGATARVHFVPERGEVWSTIQASGDGGFVVLRFTNGVWPFEE